MRYSIITMIAAAALISSCGGGEDKAPSLSEQMAQKKTEESKPVDPMQDKGIGPVKSVTLGELNQEMVGQGEELFNSKCSACHKTDKRFIGPALTGVIERRTPEWIMNMILNPEEMVQKNKIARDLLMEYSAPMANQSLVEDEARAILEYFRTLK